MIEERLQEHARSGEQLDLAGHELDAEVLYELLVSEDVAARSVRLRGAVIIESSLTSMNAEQPETRGGAEHGSRGSSASTTRN